MARADDDVQSWLSSLPYKYRRELARAIKEEADGLAAAIKERAPRKSGALAGTVKVRRKRNELDLEVAAGGDGTVKEVRSGSGEDYDYALAIEFGTSKMQAQPFFYNTARELMPAIRERIEQRVGELTSREGGLSFGSLAFGVSVGRILGSAAFETAVPVAALPPPVLELNLVDGVWS
ncbi:HK97-gp10 family putative phage morphogenesis protein [Rhodopseudomonas telluris]|uniref:HK97-gp10 family putative phage morphogenesis protein n=1 Tax=Rhodopseudomonas telluris TaxID=644215 RepID=A0ABV6F029_9BRAD